MRPRAMISEAEMKIMELLWEKSPRTMPELRAILEPEMGWSKYTVISILKRMLEKGTVRAEDAKPARMYYPLVERETVEQDQARKLLDGIFRGRVTLLVNSMVEQGCLTDGDIDELIEYLEGLREGETGRG